MQTPEMTKRRPVIVISPKMKDRYGLCTVVPLSTTPPRPVKSYHMRLQTRPTLPHPYDCEFHWVKADMVYTVGFERLFVPCDGKDESGKRIYDQRVVSSEELAQIQQCLLLGLGLRLP